MLTKKTQNLINLAEIMDKKLKKLAVFIDEDVPSDKSTGLSFVYNLALKIDDIVNSSIVNLLTPDIAATVEYDGLAPYIVRQQNNLLNLEPIEFRLRVDTNKLDDIARKYRTRGIRDNDNLDPILESSWRDVNSGIFEALKKIQENILSELSNMGFGVTSRKAHGKFTFKHHGRDVPFYITLLTGMSHYGDLVMTFIIKSDEYRGRLGDYYGTGFNRSID